MFKKSTSKDRKIGPDKFSSLANWVESEVCSLCDREIPSGKLLLRKVENGKIICLICMIELAEVE